MSNFRKSLEKQFQGHNVLVTVNQLAHVCKTLTRAARVTIYPGGILVFRTRGEQPDFKAFLADYKPPGMTYIMESLPWYQGLIHRVRIQKRGAILKS